MSSLLDDLNEPQREAVMHGDGPLLVLAGAGSGKTRVLTYRIASGAASSAEITAVTFTNKAAREMQERVEGLLRRPLHGGFVGTFHRWALELLRRHPRAAGLPPRFGIADGDDQRALMQTSLKDLGLDPRELPPRMVLSKISGLVNRGVDRPRLRPAIPSVLRCAAMRRSAAPSRAARGSSWLTSSRTPTTCRWTS